MSSLQTVKNNKGEKVARSLLRTELKSLRDMGFTEHGKVSHSSGDIFRFTHPHFWSCRKVGSSEDYFTQRSAHPEVSSLEGQLKPGVVSRAPSDALTFLEP